MKTAHPKILVSIVGPTAVGKTSLSLEIAEILRTEIISADSRQFFRELEIGTAKPSKEEQTRVLHHFINSHSIHDIYDVGKYEKDVIELLKTKFKSYNSMVLVGGSGLYCKAVWEGLDEYPKVKDGIREELIDELAKVGLAPLLNELEEKDSVYAEVVDKKNHQRVVRALEIIRSTGRPFSSFHSSKPSTNRQFKSIKIGLEMSREKLYQRIDERMEKMIYQGLFEEVASLLPFEKLNALQTVGYSEVFGFLNGEYGKEEAVRLLKRNSRRYAKRQLTWFKRDEEIQWFSPTETNKAISYVRRLLNT